MIIELHQKVKDSKSHFIKNGVREGKWEVGVGAVQGGGLVQEERKFSINIGSDCIFYIL